MKKTNLATPTNSFLSVQDDYLPIALSENEYSDNPHPQKDNILQYLKSFNYSWITSQCVTDRKDNQTVNTAEKLYNDGKFEWSESDIYHFEKYNLTLCEEFINHIFNRT
ncbi:MAG: hypothetical protein Q4B62_07015 [Clostridiaceae bacterium]|nr:hypothetical protein [Clostridiaceae bacterium]